MHKLNKLLALLLAAVLGATAAANDSLRPEGGDAATTEAESGDGAADLIFSDVAKQFRRHCVQVYLYGKTNEGKRPMVSSLDEDIRHERPTPVGGYWWDDTHVIIPDPIIQDQYIRYSEVKVSGDDATYPARVVGRFTKLQAILIEVEEDEKGKTPTAYPLEFVEGDVDEAFIMSYDWEDGEWRVKAKTGLGESALSDADVESLTFAGQGVIHDMDGLPIGLAFGEKVILDEDDSYWSGREVKYTPFFERKEALRAREKLRGQLTGAVLESRFRIRIKIDDDEDEDASWSLDNMDDGLSHGGSAEVRAAALVVGKRHLLVPVALPPEGIFRIENITVLDASGRELDADFVGALREYMAVLLEVKENLPIQNLPNGFGLLNPLAGPGLSGETQKMARPVMHYFQRWRVDYSLGRRREMADYDRWLGTFRGYRGDTVVLTGTNEEDGSLAFDTDGNLVAIALTPRLLKSRNGDSDFGLTQKASPGFRPLDFVEARLRSDDAFDPFLMPVDEEQGQRLVDPGVEVQSLDANTARLFHVSRESRGGRIGLLTTYVYPGSTAAKIGIEEHDVLLRLFIEGKNEPMELRSSGFNFQSAYDGVDMSSDSFQSMLRFMPPPWPSRENVLSTLLTGAGPGRKATLEFMREGEAKKVEFTTEYFEPDYRTAKKERFVALGLTVKPITFEVARFFSRSDLSGVIVSKVEEGGKSSVAGLHHYLLITRVDGKPVAGLDDFRDKVDAFEKGGARSVELTVEGFGKTRLVKIE